MKVVLCFPLELPSLANLPMHWTAKAKITRKQKEAVKLAMQEVPKEPTFPLLVELTRISSRELDSDNLCSCLKHVRDAVSLYFFPDSKIGSKDGIKYFIWKYDQRKGKAKEQGLEIAITL